MSAPASAVTPSPANSTAVPKSPRTKAAPAAVKTAPPPQPIGLTAQGSEVFFSVSADGEFLSADPHTCSYGHVR